MIKDVKDKIIMFFLFFNFICTIYIPCLGHYIEKISIYYFIGSLFTFISVSLLNKKIVFSKFVKYICGYYLLLLIPTILNNGSLYSLVFENGISVMSFLLWGYFDKNKVLKYLRAPAFAFEVLTYINFFIVIFFPDGLYHVSTVRNYYLFDHVNVAIRYLLPGTCLILVADYIKNKKIGLRSYFYIFCVLITLLITKPITGLLGYLIFILSYIVMTKKLFQKIITPFKAFCYSGIMSFLIIGANIQIYFRNFIENILHKDITFSGRIDIWNKALIYFKLHPIIGIGRVDSIKRTLMLGASSTHNQFLNFLFEGGVLLLLYIFALIFVVSKRILKCTDTKIKNIFISTMISYAFMWITEPFSYSGTFALFFIWMLMYFSSQLFNAKKDADNCE